MLALKGPPIVQAFPVPKPQLAHISNGVLYPVREPVSDCIKTNADGIRMWSGWLEGEGLALESNITLILTLFDLYADGVIAYDKFTTLRQGIRYSRSRDKTVQEIKHLQAKQEMLKIMSPPVEEIEKTEPVVKKVRAVSADAQQRLAWNRSMMLGFRQCDPGARRWIEQTIRDNIQRISA